MLVQVYVVLQCDRSGPSRLCGVVAANFMWQKWQNLDPPKGPGAPFATFFALRSASICLKDISLLPLFSDYYLTFLYLSLSLIFLSLLLDLPHRSISGAVAVATFSSTTWPVVTRTHVN